MTVTDFYNRFMELAQHAQAGAGDTLALITKFRKRLRPTIFKKLVDHRFTSLVDFYAAAQQAKASLYPLSKMLLIICLHLLSTSSYFFKMEGKNVSSKLTSSQLSPNHFRLIKSAYFSFVLS